MDQICKDKGEIESKILYCILTAYESEKFMTYEAVFKQEVRLFIVLIVSNEQIKKENFSFKIYLATTQIGGYFYNVLNFEEIIVFYRIQNIEFFRVKLHETNFPIFNFNPQQEVLGYEINSIPNNSNKSTLFLLKDISTGIPITPITEQMHEGFIH